MKLNRLILVLGLILILTGFSGCVPSGFKPSRLANPSPTPAVTPPAQSSGDVDQDLTQSDQEMSQFDSDTDLQLKDSDLGL